MKFPTHCFSAIGAFVLVLSCTTTPPLSTSLDYQRGQHAARDSIQRDELIFLDPVGIVRADTIEHRAFLRDRFGIAYRFDMSVTGDFSAGFNSVMDAEARRRFGERYEATFIEEKHPEWGWVRIKPNADKPAHPTAGNVHL